MYQVRTYFYWGLILGLQFLMRLEFAILWLFRKPFLKYLQQKFLQTSNISLEFQQDPKIFPKQEKDPDRLTIKIGNPNLMLRVVCEGSLPLGEGFIDGELEVDSVEKLMLRFAAFRNKHGESPLFKLRNWVYTNSTEFPWETSSEWMTPAAKEGISNMMGGHSLNFMSGYWDSPEIRDFKAATVRNMEVIGRKLELQPGMTVVDIGCGTGVFAKYLASTYGVSVIGINICEDEVREGNEQNSHADVDIVLGDYRSLLPKYKGAFDRVISIHLTEHIGGPTCYDEYFHTISSYLKPNVGKVFIQTLVGTGYLPFRVDLFARKYVVPHQVLPYTTDIYRGLAKENLVIQSLEGTGHYYKRTIYEYLANIKNLELPSAQNMRSVKAFAFGIRSLTVFLDLKDVDVWEVLACVKGKA